MHKILWLVLVQVVLAGVASIAQAREWTDLSGKFRITAEYLILRNGKVVLEKPDGSIISVPLERLSEADQKHVQGLIAGKTPPATQPAKPATAPAKQPATESASAPNVPIAELPMKVHAILKANCHRCHGEEGTSEGGFNFVLNLEKLSESMVKAKHAGDSLLYERMTDSDSSAMPPIDEEVRPSATDIALVKAWIDAGAPALKKAPREFITNEQVVKYIASDLKNANERSQKFLRYFTLTHAYNAGDSDDELQTYRNAFAKLVNSLSWSNSVVMPTAIDPAKTILRVDIRELNWTASLWEAVEEANPYFLANASPDALSCYDMTEAKMPYVRLDWFVHAASKPPLYHTILDIPDNVVELEDTLRVNAAANIRQEKVVRAGFNRSGVSQNNRLIEWHSSPYGSYWKSYDFGGNTGPQNLFERPLGPDGVDQPFRHDGGEMIFTLPNGFQGYMLVDASGGRIDKGPTEIVSDPKQADKTVTNGVSCMSCHYTGIIQKSDEINGFVSLNKIAFENADDVLALYPGTEVLNELYAKDAKRFAAALEKIGIKSLSRSGEPISAMALKFQEELDLTHTAYEFGLRPEELVERIEKSEVMARSFGALRTKGGTIKRDVFATLFGKAAIEFRLTIEANLAFTGSTVGLVRIKNDGDANVGSIRSFPDMGWGVKSLAFSPNGGVLAAGKMDNAVLMFDVQKSGRLQSKEKLRDQGSIECCEFTPDGTKFLAGGGHIAIWNVNKDGLQEELGQFVGHSGNITCMSISPDGRFVLSGGAEKKARYWELSEGREKALFDGFGGAVKACRILPNGREALATDGAALLHIDLRTLKVTKTSQLNRSWASGQAAAISADGRLVAVGDSSDIRIWEVETGKELTKLEGGKGIQWSMTFTPDGTRLLSGDLSRLNVWDVKTARRLSAIGLISSGYIHTVAASPDNIHASAISGNAGSTLEVVRLPKPE